MSDEFDSDAQAHVDEESSTQAEQSTEDSAEMSDSGFVLATGRNPLSKGSLAMFLIIVLAKAGVFFMYKRSGPSAAEAAVDKKAQQVISQFMSDKTNNLNLMQKMLRDTESVVQQFLAYPSVTQIPLADLRTNPFRATPAKTDNGAESAMSKAEQEKEKKRREEERLAVLRAVQGLQLQSVMVSGANKACMISNTLYQEGQQCGEFMIEKIANNSVIVRNGSYRFELRMQK